MQGFIDLHCHWVAGIDDGARSVEAGIAMLRGLGLAGFDIVVATPHMRPGMFDNDQAALSEAFAAMGPPVDAARKEGPLPAVHLASEHFFDDVVFDRIRRGEGLPYPSFAPSFARSFAPAAPAQAPLLAAGANGKNGRAAAWTPPAKPAKRGVLVEFAPERFPLSAHHRFFDLHRSGYLPVVAHPERYAPVWKDTASLAPFVEAGAYLLLDVCSLVGKYGRAAQRASEKLIEESAYAAACSDAHKPEDIDVVVEAIARLKKLVGEEGARELLSSGPRRILNIPDAGSGT
jgi:protein-tyrosine phosphatase